MREKFNVNDEFGNTQIKPGQFFDLVFWAAESVLVVGQYTRKGFIILHWFDDDTNKFVSEQKLTIKSFKKLNIGHNYCDIVILGVYPPGTNIKEINEQYKKD